MFIRPVMPHDINDVMLMLHTMSREAPAFQHIPEDAYATVKAKVLAMLSTDNVYGQIIPDTGLMLACITTPWYSTIPEANELVLYVYPEHRGSTAVLRLVRAVERMTRTRGFMELGVGISSRVHPEKTRAMYESMGYTICGYSLTKRLI